MSKTILCIATRHASMKNFSTRSLPLIRYENDSPLPSSVRELVRAIHPYEMPGTNKISNLLMPLFLAFLYETKPKAERQATQVNITWAIGFARHVPSSGVTCIMWASATPRVIGRERSPMACSLLSFAQQNYQPPRGDWIMDSPVATKAGLVKSVKAAAPV